MLCLMQYWLVDCDPPNDTERTYEVDSVKDGQKKAAALTREYAAWEDQIEEYEGEPEDPDYLALLNQMPCSGPYGHFEIRCSTGIKYLLVDEDPLDINSWEMQ